MAETLGVEYYEVVQAAIIPAILYFASAFWMVHLEAGRHNLVGLPKDELPSPLKALREQWFLVLPLFDADLPLVFGLQRPLFAGTRRPRADGAADPRRVDSAGTFFGRDPALIFWVGLGLVAAAFLQFGIMVILAAVLALIAWNAFSQGRPRDASRSAAMRWPTGPRPRCRWAWPAPWSASSSAR